MSAGQNETMKGKLVEKSVEFAAFEATSGKDLEDNMSSLMVPGPVVWNTTTILFFFLIYCFQKEEGKGIDTSVMRKNH